MTTMIVSTSQIDRLVKDCNPNHLKDGGDDYDTELAARQGCGVHLLASSSFLDPNETSELVLTGYPPWPERTTLQQLDSTWSQNNPSGTASKPVSRLGRPRSRHGVVILHVVVPLV